LRQRRLPVDDRIAHDLVLNLIAGALVMLAVFVAAQTAMRLSSVPKNSRALRKYCVPLLLVAKLPPGGTIAGWTV